MAALPEAKGAGLESAAEAAARTLGIDGLRVAMLAGVPYMEGTVPSFRHKRAAAELIGLLTGASHVVNRLRVTPRQAISDRALDQRVQAALEEAPGVDIATTQLEVRDGTVELRGTASSLSARCAAEQAVWSVGGVADLVNRLRVAGTAASAHDLARQLERDIRACLGLPAASVAVHVQGGRLRLEGTVPSPYHRLAAEDLVRAHEMVQDVVNSLTVTLPVEAAPRPRSAARPHTRAS